MSFWGRFSKGQKCPFGKRPRMDKNVLFGTHVKKVKGETRMLAYIKGTLEMKMTGYIVIDVGGLGYKVFMSDSGIEKLGNIGEVVKVHTYYKVREDDISIFGFNSLEELRMFELLISVSGIGAKTAIAMLDVCEPTEFALAIISEDIKTLTQIPGIGAKSAQRIILELKDKMKKEQQIQELTKANNNNVKTKLEEKIEHEEKIQEAIAALQVLGYNKKEIEKAFDKIVKDNMTTEELIRKGLTILGK